jgi:tetratricopeptide (TPR) repeat protein
MLDRCSGSCRRVFGVAAVVWLAAFSPSRDAWAQAEPPSPESQAADALFRQAKALMEKGDLEPACEKFAASQALEPGLGTLLYLGDCHERAGHFASALATFREASILAEERDDDQRLRLAKIRVRALEPRAPKLEVRHGAGPLVRDLQITVGGAPLPTSELGKPLPRDAGRYDIRFSAPGYEPFVSHIDLKNAASVVVTVPRLVPLEGSAGRVAEDMEVPGQTQRTVAWIVGGTGLALLATAGVFAGLASSKNRDSKADCDAADPNRCGPTGVELRNDAESFANVATVASILGGVGLASGLVIYVTAPDTEDAPGQAALLRLQGTF